MGLKGGDLEARRGEDCRGEGALGSETLGSGVHPFGARGTGCYSPRNKY